MSGKWRRVCLLFHVNMWYWTVLKTHCYLNRTGNKWWKPLPLWFNTITLPCLLNSQEVKKCESSIRKSGQKMENTPYAERTTAVGKMEDKAKDYSRETHRYFLRETHRYFLYPHNTKVPLKTKWVIKRFYRWEKSLRTLAAFKRIKHLNDWHSFIFEAFNEENGKLCLLGWFQHSNSSN